MASTTTPGTPSGPPPSTDGTASTSPVTPSGRRPTAMSRPVLIVWTVVAALVVGAGLYSTLGSGGGQSVRSRLAVIAPAAPGGGWDGVAREAQRALRDEGIVNNVQVVNIPGAAGTIGLGQLAGMSGQGGTLMVTGTVMVGGIIANDADTTLADVTPIARLAEDYEVLVVPGSSPYQNLTDFIAAWKADPQGMAIGGGSKGGTDHLLAGLIARAGGVDTAQLNYLAFSGGGEALNAILSSTTDASISGYNEFADQIEAGNVRALAIGTKERVDGIDIPSLGEQGIDVELTNWRGLVAPPGLTAEQNAALVEVVTQMRDSADWQDTLARNRWQDTFISGPEFQSFLTQNTQEIQQIADDLGIGA
nr:tripartite tricarboxylate transporter substrate-binding protein [Nakamurella flava]